MGKNIIFIPYIKREKDVTKASSIGKPRHHQGYEFGIKSWKQWASKNNAEVVIFDQLIAPESEMLITWQRWKALDILEHSGIDYDQVLVVDADSIVHPNCPNFFEMTDNKLTTVPMNGCYEFVNRSIKGYSRLFFNCDYLMPAHEFFQTGFVIMNKSHKELFNKIFDFYNQNKLQIIRSYDTILAGSDITLINLLCKKFKADIKYLSSAYSLEHIYAKKLLSVHPRNEWWEDTLDNLYNSAFIYQFNAIPETPERDRTYWMGRICNELYNNK